jgi:hypothetical protein
VINIEYVHPKGYDLDASGISSIQDGNDHIDPIEKIASSMSDDYLE